jgi:hypothetical protein
MLHYCGVINRLVTALETKRVVQAVCGSYHTAGVSLHYILRGQIVVMLLQPFLS